MSLPVGVNSWVCGRRLACDQGRRVDSAEEQVVEDTKEARCRECSRGCGIASVCGGLEGVRPLNLVLIFSRKCLNFPARLQNSEVTRLINASSYDYLAGR